VAKPNDHLADLHEVERVVQLVSTTDAWTTAVDVVLAGPPASYTSAAYDIASTTGAWVLIFVDSTGAPTTVRVLVQFSHDAGFTWWDFEEGLWASLYWEDADTASGIHKAFLLPCAGQDLLRFVVTGVGTAAGALFAVQVFFRAFRGGYAGAHA
jgi:hypothetical protein